jgi:type IV secretory pathway VirB4 component
MAQRDARALLYLRALDRARVAIASGAEKLFEMRLTLTVVGKSYEELRERSLALARSLDYVDAPSRVQRIIYELGRPSWAAGRWIYITSSGLSAFFPFAGMDLVDPGGTFIGLNLQTGNAVVLDVFERDNYNVLVLGQSGYGKSMLIKAWLSRLSRLDDRSLIYVFDSIVRPEYALGPDGTYETSLAKDIGAVALRFSDPGATFGFDPFTVFDDKRDAGEFIRELAKVEEGSDQAVELLSLAGESSSVQDLISRASPELRRRLEAELEPMMRYFTGRTDLYDRMVFVLSDVPSSFVRDALAFLILRAVWSLIKEQPVSLRKYIVVDEGWAFVEANPRTGRPYFPLAVEHVPEIARTGRHYSSAFIIASQLVSDFVRGAGRAVLENSATKIVLKQDSASLRLIRDALSLSEAEARFVLTAKPGQGILITPEGHVPFYSALLPEELRKFTTRAV